MPESDSIPAEERGAATDASVDPADGAVEVDVDALVKERDELRALAQRVQAEFENYRKRMLREQTDAIGRANEALVEQLLPVLDGLELALRQLGDVDENVRKGVELVGADLIGVLEKAGLERIDAVGVPFDPNVHEAVIQEGDHGDPVVVEAIRTGYRFKGKVLRPALVKVARED